MVQPVYFASTEKLDRLITAAVEEINTRNIFPALKEYLRYKASSYISDVQLWKGVTKHLGFSPNTVYYPGCGEDVTPTIAFPDSRVVYVDTHSSSMEMLRRLGLEAYSGDAEEQCWYDGKDIVDSHSIDLSVDLMILKATPLLKPKIPASFVKEEGYVFSDNWYKCTENLNRIQGYKLKAAIYLNYQSDFPEFIVDEDNPSDCLVNHTVEEEFERAPHYFKAKDTIIETYGKIPPEGVLNMYTRLMDDARKQMAKSGEKIMEEGFSPFPSLIYRYNGRFVYLSPDVLKRKEKPLVFVQRRIL